MCYLQHSLSQLMPSIIAVAGTLAGVFIGALFSYLSIDKQFKHSIKKMRIERKIVAYEDILGFVIAAKSSRNIEINGSRYATSIILMKPQYFSKWYPDYHITWNQKQYHLDPTSLKNCELVSNFIQEFIDSHPKWHLSTDQNDPQQEISAELHKRFLLLLDNAYESLKLYLNKNIEND
jgi:hypothetical protein